MVKRALGRVLRVLNRVAYAIEKRYDAARWRVRQRLGVGPVEVLPYIGYGTQTHAYLQGRAVADRRVREPLASDTVWYNLLNMIRRFHTHELPHVRLRARLAGREQTVRTDEEGHFAIEIALGEPLPPGRIWHEMELELVDYTDQPGAYARAPVMVPPPDAEFAVVSDLDDTVIQTNIVNLFKAARNTFLRNAYTRLAFPGVAAFYRALQRGTRDTFNPLFYVSTMPCNLFDLMRDFFTIRDVPPGPMFLVNLGLTKHHFIRRPGREHKLEWICTLIELYDHLPFVLIGDSGEGDPAIYVDVLQRYPDRVRAIYIRDVVRGRRDEAIWSLTRQAGALGVDLLLVRNTLAAARHAADHGLITPDAVDRIRAELAETAQPGVDSVATRLPL